MGYSNWSGVKALSPRSRAIQTTTLALAATPLLFKVTVTNRGGPDGCYSALGFVASSHKEAPRNRKLFGYDRANVPANATATLTVRLKKDECVLVAENGTTVLLPGDYRIVVAGLNFSLSLSGPPLVVAQPLPLFMNTQLNTIHTV